MSKTVYTNFTIPELSTEILSNYIRILHEFPRIFKILCRFCRENCAERTNNLFASVLSAAILGIEVCPVKVEADVSDGLPTFIMVGFASQQVKEAQDRVRTALKNNGISLPPKRITVNLAPADIRKEGSGFDLPVAAAVLAASGILPKKTLEGGMIVGEIGLNGEVQPVSGILPRVIHAREAGLKFCMIPYANLEEGRLIRDMKVMGVRDMHEMMEYLMHPEQYQLSDKETEEKEEIFSVDFSEIRGQEGARRAAEIAVSGFHNLLFIGPPGSGKTMLAKRIPTIMPSLTFEESLELTRIYSVAGLLTPEKPLIRMRPFRSPHHTSSAQALAGGGRFPRPGEITLAHRGVLFLDEMAEFSKRSLEILRQPLEDKRIVLSRAAGSFVFPANFMLVAATNPCPCGCWPSDQCHCTPFEIEHYLGRISQPLLDRIDLCADIPAVTYDEMTSLSSGESSDVIRARVEEVRRIQAERYRSESFSFNGELSGGMVQKYCCMTEEAEHLLKTAFNKMKFSARSYHKILKTARTIADLDKSEHIASSHIAEALTYRAMDKKYWNR